MDLLHKVRVVLTHQSYVTRDTDRSKVHRYREKNASGQHKMKIPEDSTLFCFFILNPLKFRWFAGLLSCKCQVFVDTLLLHCKSRGSTAASGWSTAIPQEHKSLRHLTVSKINILVQCFFCFSPCDLYTSFATTCATLISIMNSSGVPGLMESTACRRRKYLARKIKSTHIKFPRC